MFENFWTNFVGILGRLWDLFMGLVNVLGIALTWLAGVVGVLAGFLFVLFLYVLVGAILEEWFQWAVKRGGLRFVRILTLIAWLPVALIALAAIGSVPLTMGWILSVDLAIIIGAVGVLFSIVINAKFEPLQWLFKPVRRLFGSLRPKYATMRATKIQSVREKPDATSKVIRNLVIDDELVGTIQGDWFMLKGRKAGFVSIKALEPVTA